MTKQNLINYWKKQADLDFKTMEDMFKSKHYHWALFVGHLVVEKLLKALFVKIHSNNTPIPKIHNLYELAKRDNLQLSQEISDKLDIITSFNIQARYQNEKESFYKLCTKTYTAKWIKEIKEIKKWLKNLISQ
ncbi:MAG: HEPN domain-containing protein [Endomicrobium sp.]|jgi:HEPN domain-containing protein|nr:HEPN domain-containing protein [Endomicrobium sp.]